MRFRTSTQGAGASLLILVALSGNAGVAGQKTSPVTSIAFDSVEVSAALHYSSAGGDHRPAHVVDPRAVIWMEPLNASPKDIPRPGAFAMTQKNKAFHPEFLVVPLGSTVSFPNADPFFHNVFSLFNGRRFDLGLYQSDQTRTVTFNREGVSYIFCNIHPQMSAVIISLKTPYFTSSDGEGPIRIRNVEEGSYRLQIWSNLASPETLNALTRVVKVERKSVDLGTIEIQALPTGSNRHLNKFGLPYDTHLPPNLY